MDYIEHDSPEGFLSVARPGPGWSATRRPTG